ncbi:MAG: LytTR family DNA-binding domain-containing protein [Eubacteriales bacterium]|nr:LytTR family DNA-binding domain-containing protein [Eubacteriales bacterium]
MLKIAICDDDANALKIITEYIKDYLKDNNIVAEINEFSHPDILLNSLNTEVYHIILLDMVMPMISGLDLGRKIRRTNTDAQIIYVTTEPQFALDAYSANPLDYLLKPLDKSVFHKALALAFEKTSPNADKTIIVKTRDGLHTISIDKILCAEYIKHKVCYTLVGSNKIETVSSAESFAMHIAPLLEDKRFISPHSSFALNMSFVERFDKNGFSLKGTVFVPISGKQYTTVRNTYLNYRFGA